MTPERKRALQWFHDRGDVHKPQQYKGAPSEQMIKRMIDDQQLGRYVTRYGFGVPFFRLTDKGRRMLRGNNA